MTWELEENIPKHLLEEFLSGVQPVACDKTMTSGIGGVLHTLTVQHSSMSVNRSSGSSAAHSER